MVYGLLLMQGLQLTLSNYLSFGKEDTNNFLINNILITTMSSIFVIFNAYLYVRLSETLRDHVIISFGTMASMLVSIIFSNYNWKYAREFDISTITIYCFVGIALVLIFGYI